MLVLPGTRQFDTRGLLDSLELPIGVINVGSFFFSFTMRNLGTSPIIFHSRARRSAALRCRRSLLTVAAESTSTSRARFSARFFPWRPIPHDLQRRLPSASSQPAYQEHWSAGLVFRCFGSWKTHAFRSMTSPTQETARPPWSCERGCKAACPVLPLGTNQGGFAVCC